MLMKYQWIFRENPSKDNINTVHSIAYVDIDWVAMFSA